MNRSSIRQKEVVSEHAHIVYNEQALADLNVEPDALWSHADAVSPDRGARGTVAFFSVAERELAFKHYCRGGFPARFTHDHYFFYGTRHTRPWVEWRALCILSDAGLPVPEPVSARYKKKGLLYTADLITVSLRPAYSLSEYLSAHSLSREMWRAIGAVARAVNVAGVRHADLNAHNILLNPESNSDEVAVVDFDRASVGNKYTSGHTSDKALARLRHSLDKLHTQNNINFTPDEWRDVVAGYRAG